jgi:hypothetical protein
VADPAELARVAAAFGAVYGGGAVHRARPGDGVVTAIDAYRGEAHWHLVTLRTAGAGAGAFEHELTVLTPPAPSPPAWAFALLAGVARTLRAAGRGLHAGARMAPGEPVDGAGSGLVALGVREDPLVTVPGLPLLQVVGVTAGEYAVMGRVGTAVVLAKLAERDPLLRTDPARA